MVPAGRVGLPSSQALIRDPQLLERLSDESRFLPRSVAERDTAFKQLIPYSVLRWQNSVFRYQRSESGLEQRLHSRLSIGVGGHVNPTDVHSSGLVERLDAARDREAREEFDFDPLGRPRLIGWINDESDEVGRVHLGAVYEWRLSSRRVIAREPESFRACELVTLSDLGQHLHEYENWSRIVIASLRG